MHKIWRVSISTVVEQLWIGTKERLKPFVGGADRRKLVLNSSLFLGDKLVCGILRFASFAFLARLYGPVTTGRWSYVIALFGLVLPVLSTGLEPVTILRFVESPERKGDIAGSAAALIFVSTLISLFGSLCWLLLTSGHDWAVLLIGVTIAGGYIPNFLLIIEHSLKAELRAKPVVIVHVGAAMIGALVRTGLSFEHVPIQFVAISNVIELWCGAVGFLLVTGSWDSLFSWRVRKVEVVPLFRVGGALVLSALLVTLFFRLNFIILQMSGSYKEVGKYAVASTIAQLLILAPSAVATAIYPKMAQVEKSSSALFEVYMRWLVYAFTCLGYGLFLLLLLITPFITTLFGARYQGTQYVLLMLGVATVFSCGGIGRAVFINIKKTVHRHVISALVGILVISVSSSVLIPILGSLGAAIGFALASFASAYLTTPFFPELRGVVWSQFKALLLIPPANLDQLRTFIRG